eukprot:15478765-Alexandrium_andersonii.AAC.1
MTDLRNLRNLSDIEPDKAALNMFWETPKWRVHTGVPTVFGSKATSVPHKIHNMLHALIIELGSWHSVRMFCRGVSVIVTDMGVEKCLATATTDILTHAFLPDAGYDVNLDQDNGWWHCDR